MGRSEKAPLLALALASLAFPSCPLFGPTREATEVVGPELSDRVEETRRHCGSSEISALPCETETTLPAIYQPANLVIQAGQDVATTYSRNRRQLSIISAFAGPTLFSPFLFSEIVRESSGFNDRTEEARKAIRYLIDEVNSDIGGFESLDSCHKVCLLQCMTSGLIQYSADPSRADTFDFLVPHVSDEGPYEAVARGDGVCRNYASLAEEIGEQIGQTLEMVSTMSGSHVVVKYKDGAHQYIMEPQRDPISDGTCRRFRL